MGVHKTVNGAYRCRYAPFANILCNGVQPLGSPFGRAVTAGDGEGLAVFWRAVFRHDHG